MTRIVQLKHVGKMVVRGVQSKIKESVAIAFVSYQFHPFPYFFPMGLALTVSSFPILPSLISVVSIHLPFPNDNFPHGSPRVVLVCKFLFFTLLIAFLSLFCHVFYYITNTHITQTKHIIQYMLIRKEKEIHECNY